MDPAALVGGALERALEGGDKPGVLVGDHPGAPRPAHAGASTAGTRARTPRRPKAPGSSTTTGAGRGRFGPTLWQSCRKTHREYTVRSPFGEVGMIGL
jgi:hypothetical protein